MNKSESIAALAAALAKAQAETKVAIKGNINPHFKSRYADLGAVIDACREAMSKNGIAWSQVPSVRDGGIVVLTTIIMHSSGEWLSGEYPIQPTKNDPQGMGSALTYARRYSLSSMLGIAADEDDDGNAGSGNGRTQFVSAPETAALMALAEEVGADKPKFCAYFKVPSFAEIPANRYDEARAALEAKRKKPQ